MSDASRLITLESFGDHVVALVDELGLRHRLALSLLSQDRAPAAAPRRVRFDALEGGRSYQVYLDGRKTELQVDLFEWREGLETSADARLALERIERVLRAASALRELNREVARVPSPLSSLYIAEIDPSNTYLTINPRPRRSRESRSPSRSRGPSVAAQPTEAGGQRIGLALPDGRPARFREAQWVRERPLDAITAATRAHHGEVEDLDARVAAACELVRARGLLPEQPADLLRVTAEATSEPIYLMLSPKRARLGMICVCSEVTALDFGKPREWGVARTHVMRKPVVYFWPQTTVELQVEVTPAGLFVAQYPKQNAGEGRWQLIATPDGLLRDPQSERSYAYLFWEAEGGEFSVDRAQAHCVRADEAAAFLERVAAAHRLEPRERTDFISYWLPALEANPYSLVQLLSPAAYARHAALRVSPEPDTLIRLFMIFERAEAPQPVGTPALPSVAREGFCVVEWGGVNLDE